MSYLLQKYNYALEKWLNVREYNSRKKADHGRAVCIRKDRGKYRVIKNE